MPEDFAFAGSGYLPACEGFTPPKGIYSHISGIDLVEGRDGSWFVLTGAETKVWPSGLTRFSREPDSFVVNSSQGGGFKDTWVLSD